MSLSRAFTTVKRNKRLDLTAPAPLPQRSLTTKLPQGTIKRAEISAPVELLSTTNMLSYNAPDIYPRSASSTTSTHSGNDSEDSHMGTSTPMTSPDTSSIESTPSSPEPNHLSCYFGTPSRQSLSGDEAPSIPRRAVSHTKKSHEILSRKRSMNRMSASKNSTSTARSSFNLFSGNIEIVEPHPFGQELAQVTEIAEEYGISQEKMAVIDEEEQELISRGLFKFCAEDYMSEIHGLFMSTFGDVRPSLTPVWI